MCFDINQEIICQFRTDFRFLKIDGLNDHLKITYKIIYLWSSTIGIYS